MPGRVAIGEGIVAPPPAGRPDAGERGAVVMPAADAGGKPNAGAGAGAGAAAGARPNVEGALDAAELAPVAGKASGDADAEAAAAGLKGKAIENAVAGAPKPPKAELEAMGGGGATNNPPPEPPPKPPKPAPDVAAGAAPQPPDC